MLSGSVGSSLPPAWEEKGEALGLVEPAGDVGRVHRLEKMFVEEEPAIDGSFPKSEPIGVELPN
jgi:hypothetical protein